MAIIGGIPHFQTYPYSGFSNDKEWFWQKVTTDLQVSTVIHLAETLARDGADGNWDKNRFTIHIWLVVYLPL